MATILIFFRFSVSQFTAAKQNNTMTTTNKDEIFRFAMKMKTSLAAISKQGTRNTRHCEYFMSVGDEDEANNVESSQG
jgi:hypothetical protein